MNKKLLTFSLLISLSGCGFVEKTTDPTTAVTTVTTATIWGLAKKVIGGRRQRELDGLQHEINVSTKELEIEKNALEITKVAIEHDKLNTEESE